MQGNFNVDPEKHGVVAQTTACMPYLCLYDHINLADLPLVQDSCLSFSIVVLVTRDYT
jgi:hypothetical protein